MPLHVRTISSDDALKADIMSFWNFLTTNASAFPVNSTIANFQYDYESMWPSLDTSTMSNYMSGALGNGPKQNLRAQLSANGGPWQVYADPSAKGWNSAAGQLIDHAGTNDPAIPIERLWIFSVTRGDVFNGTAATIVRNFTPQATALLGRAPANSVKPVTAIASTARFNAIQSSFLPLATTVGPPDWQGEAHPSSSEIISLFPLASTAVLRAK
jgi:hypothetical protein